MKKQMPIHKMVDSVFEKGVDTLIDDIAEERTFILNTLKGWLNDDELWQDLATNKEGRKMFLFGIQELTLQEMSTIALIELATIKHEDK